MSPISWSSTPRTKRRDQQGWAGSAQATLNKVGDQLKNNAVDLYDDCQRAADKGLQSLEKGVRHAGAQVTRAALKGAIKGAWTLAKNL
jgi:hypothetical protein